MKHSLTIFLELFYNYSIGSLCKYPTTSYNNNNDNNFSLGYHKLA